MSTGESTCRTCRRAGEKLFLKGEKCFSPSCTFNKKPYAPGQSGASGKRRRAASEYGKQLQEKQKVRNTYGLRERQFGNYVKEAMKQKDVNPADTLYELLEQRLDNVVYRLGLASSRALARQMVSHGHITVNGRRSTIPSYHVKKGDKLSVREGSRAKKLFTEIGSRLQKYQFPEWVTFSPNALEGEVSGKPSAEKAEIGFDLSSVIEYYSR